MADQAGLFPEHATPAPSPAPAARCSVVGVRVEPCVTLAAAIADRAAIQWGRVERMSDAADRESVVFRGRKSWGEFKFCPFCGAQILAEFSLPVERG